MAVHRGSVSRKPCRRTAQPQLQRSRRQSRTRSCSRHCIRTFFCNGGFGTPSAVTSCAALACAAPRVPLVYTANRVQARMPGRTLWTLPGWPAAPVGGASADATTGPVGPRQRRRGEPQCPAPPSGSLPFVFVASSFWCRSPRPRRSRGALTASSNGAVLAAGVRCREAPRRQRAPGTLGRGKDILHFRKNKARAVHDMWHSPKRSRNGEGECGVSFIHLLKLYLTPYSQECEPVLPGNTRGMARPLDGTGQTGRMAAATMINYFASGIS